MIVMRFLAVLLDSTILFITYKNMSKLKIKPYFKYITLIILAYIMKSYFTIDYNWATLLCVLIITNLEISNKESKKNDIIIGIIAGLTITIKQTTGIVIFAAVLGWKLLEVRSLEDLKKYLKSTAIRFFCGLFVLIIFTCILIKIGAIYDYIDYCILGVKTFSNKITYIQGLIKSSNIIIRVLSMLPVFVYLTLGYMYLRTKKRETLILLTYSIALFVFVYPISDEAHFVVAIPVTLIAISYLLSMLADKLKISQKEEIIANSFLKNCIVLISVFYFVIGIEQYKKQNINYELKHFKYLPMEESGILSVKETEEFIQNQEKKVYILDASAALYMIPIDRYNKNYDMFNRGNLGSKGEDGQIENLKNTDNKIVLIRNYKYQRNWQNPEEVRKYVKQEMKKTGEIGIFDIYE